MTGPSASELARWSKEAVAADKGDPADAVDFAEIAQWGATPEEVSAEVNAIARELGINEPISVHFENPEGVGGALGWWNAEEKALGINQATWEAGAGWNRLETVAHEVMHAHQTLCHDDWKPGWDRYVKRAAESNDGTIERGSEEFWRRLWAYRHDPLEEEATAFGREYRDRRRVHAR